MVDLIAKNRVYDGLNGAHELQTLSDEGVGLIIVPGALLDAFAPVVREHPQTHYVFSFPYAAPNVSYFTSADQQGSFLVGAAAAAKTKTGVIGFLGGLDADFIWTFEAGFEAGARTVDPDVQILKTYLATGEDYGGAFDNPLGGRAAARHLYEQGADIVFHAAGKSGIGLLEAARDMSSPDRQLWAIGVDTDQFETVDAIAGVVDSASLRRHILTSMLKRVDVGTYTVLDAYAHGNLHPGPYPLDLANGAIGIAYSGGFIDDIRPRIEAFKAQIESGEIDVPCVTEERHAAADQAAARQGWTLTPEGCRH